MSASMRIRACALALPLVVGGCDLDAAVAPGSTDAHRAIDPSESVVAEFVANPILPKVVSREVRVVPADAAVDGGIGYAAVLEGLPVSSAQRVAQQTPLAVAADAAYLATLEPAPGADDTETGLHTVLRKASRASAAKAQDDAEASERWTVDSATIDTRGVRDAWHTAPGIGVDRRGVVHVAWNMHNFPWQYATSSTPGSLARFDFRGEPLSDEALRLHVEENRTGFPALGTADIPGTQVTYPAFYNDRDGRLWVTYRHALRPARDFEERAMGIGVARFDPAADRWEPVGVPLAAREGDWRGAREGDPSTPAFAVTPGWTAYNAKLGFADQGWQVQWAWRRGIAGSKIARPCLAIAARAPGDEPEDADVAGPSLESPDGEPLEMPVPVDACGNLGLSPELRYHSMGDFSVDSHGRAAVLLSPVGGSRMLVERTDDGAWEFVRPPDNASALFHDARDRLWAVADGPTIHVRGERGGEFAQVYAAPEGNGCEPRAALDPARERAWLYTHDCVQDRVSVATFSLDVPTPASRPAPDDQG